MSKLSQENKIIVAGEGGQGVKAISHVLGKILLAQGCKVSVFYDYDAGVRGGKITGYIKFGRKISPGPLIAKADILVKLSDKAEGFFAGREVVKDKTVQGDVAGVEIDFLNAGRQEFGDAMFGNMMIVGWLLKKVGVKLDKIDWPKVLPKKFSDKNKKAVVYGWEMQNNCGKEVLDDKVDNTTALGGSE